MAALIPDLITEFPEATWSYQSQEKYARPEIAPRDPTNAKKGRAPSVLPGSALEDYINLPSYVTCRRRVPHLYFANNKRSKSFLIISCCLSSHCVAVTGTHHLCDPDSYEGCERCRPQTTWVCCDKCNPGEFLKLITAPHKKTLTPQHSIIPSSYTRSPQHFVFKEKTYKWRREQATVHRGKGLVHWLGAQLLMPDQVIERVIVCWTFGKISHISHLWRETSWSQQWVNICSDSLLALLASHSPFEKVEENKARDVTSTHTPH
jgi:hypothetical protein